MNSSKKIPSKRLKQLLIGFAQLYFIVSLLVPMLIPAGMMIGRNSESNIVELLVCSATNPRVVKFDLNTGALVSPDQHLEMTGDQFARHVSSHPAADSKICPYDLATADQLSIVEGVDSQGPKPALEVSLAAKESRFNQLEHPSSPPRGPPLVS